MRIEVIRRWIQFHLITSMRNSAQLGVRNQKATFMENGFTISTDKNKLDVAAIHNYLCNKSYWGQGRTIEDVRKSIDNSLCFGVYDKDDALVGFARVITDFTVFAYLLDLFILESHRNCGIGKSLVEYIIKDEIFNGVRWRLDTKDAHDLYRRFGFQEPAFPERIMEKRKIANNRLHTERATAARF